MTDSSIAIPGQLIGSVTTHKVGNGTHIDGTQLYASIAGNLQPSTSTSKSKSKTSNTITSITRPHGPLLPSVGHIVLGKITRTTTKQAHLSILALGATGTHILPEPFPALIRQQDIRATEIDEVHVNESFRVGDVVRAKVISLGDERSYYLSTAGNELGVVLARSEAGNWMVPVSWREFEDEVMGVREVRKVAKPG